MALSFSTSQAVLVRTLSGHIGGVISLSQTSDGFLISGGWDGHARVWDVATGLSKFVLEGHENGVSCSLRVLQGYVEAHSTVHLFPGTCVLGLPNGDIVTGSTGRKDERDRHVDYKIRFWRKTTDGECRFVVRSTVTLPACTPLVRTDLPARNGMHIQAVLKATASSACSPTTSRQCALLRSSVTVPASFRSPTMGRPSSVTSRATLSRLL